MIKWLFLGFGLAICQQSLAKSKSPNFIIIYTDDQRQDAFGAYGNESIITPYIDKLAERGMKFTNANVVFALCSPSRAALLTGRYGSANGVLELGSGLNEREKSLASYLKENGYFTGVTGKWHLDQKPEKLGFDFHCYFESNGAYYGRKTYDQGKEVYPRMHCDEYGVQRSIDFLKEAKERNEPFFLFHNTQTPHMDGTLVWNAQVKTLHRYRKVRVPIAANRLDNLSDKPTYLKKVRNKKQASRYGYPDSLAISQHTKEYYSVITEMDGFLGELMDSVSSMGLMENTYVIFMSDNGWMLGDHGFTSKVLPYRPSTSVPLFVIGPGVQSGLNDEMVLNIDLFPTILSLAKIKIPKQIHGKDFSSLFEDGSQNIRDAFVYEGLGTYGGAFPNLTTISNDYRLIITYSDLSLEKIQFEELYDQQNDPLEMKNLIGHDDMKDIISELRSYIEDHKKKVL